MKTINEATLQKGILQYLKYRGVFCWRNNTTGVFDESRKAYRKPGYGHLNGVSDIIGIYQKRPLFIEVKTPKGRLTDAQKTFIERAKKHGALCLVARSIDDVRAFLDAPNRP